MSADAPFACDDCGQTFTVREDILARHPGWKPRQCLPCRDAKAGGGPKRGGAPKRGAKPRKRPRSVTASRVLTPEQVLKRFDDGPKSGVFTDGGASPNPGPGGWGVVHVRDDELLVERCGGEAEATNNRMELTALIEAYSLLPEDAEETVHSDSELCVKTINEWAARWERAGWKRRTGPIKNLDLVQRLHALARARPGVTLRWAPAHSGWRWNEYADALATLGREGERR